jgi:hypothetical protein
LRKFPPVRALEVEMSRKTWIISANAGLLALNVGIAWFQYFVLHNGLIAMGAAFLAGVAACVIAVATAT